MWNIIPNSIKSLHNLFKENNKELYLVGGSVRDFLIGVDPNDFDLATDATPDEILSILKNYRTNKQGAAFGVIVVYTEDGFFEIATFREDIYGSKLGETRNPDVKFTTIFKDVLRRDLTCNALFFDMENKEIVDLVGGIDDIKNKIVRFVGEPDLRIEEDPLRILRILRFASRYDFAIEEKSGCAIVKNAAKLSIITKERIWEEINKAFHQSKHFSKYFTNICEFGILRKYLEGLDTLYLHVVECSTLELYFANALRFVTTDKLIDKLKFQFKMEHDFSRKVVFLIEIEHSFDEQDIQNWFKRSNGISHDVIREWYKLRDINTSKHNAFFKYKPTTNALDLMEQGYQGKKLGAKITELEINNFLQLINKENE